MKWHDLRLRGDKPWIHLSKISKTGLAHVQIGPNVHGGWELVSFFAAAAACLGSTEPALEGSAGSAGTCDTDVSTDGYGGSANGPNLNGGSAGSHGGT